MVSVSLMVNFVGNKIADEAIKTLVILNNQEKLNLEIFQ
jgi:hypothetical protein